MDKERIRAKIEQRQRQILIHSYIYYELDDNIISDHTWGKWANELKQLQDTYPDIAKTTELYNDFKNFDPCTGHNLDFNKPWVMSVAYMLLRYRDDND